MELKPQIDFNHMMRELSVNRKDPTEVIRELISNAYDAGAQTMWYLPLLQYSGFVFVDSGTGMSSTVPVKGILPYVAFFSLGKSTKTHGMSVGYKCQGSKLCFASKRFALLTKCKDEAGWRFKSLENPFDVLSELSDLTPIETSDPVSVLEEFFTDPDSRTQPVLKALAAILPTLNSGSVIVVQGFQASNFQFHFDTVSAEKPESTFLYNYVRFCTKHGDTCRLLAEQGFSATEVDNITKRTGSDASLSLWNGKGWTNVPRGFPYLRVSLDEESTTPRLLSRLRDGRFQVRAARQVTHAGRTYAFIFAMDGRRRRLVEYPTLGRERNAASGVRLTDQCGAFVSSAGVKASPYNQVFDAPALKRYVSLKDANAQIHYALFIDGPFELVTNRNAVEQRALDVLTDAAFLELLKSFLDGVFDSKPVFRELIERLNLERTEADLDNELIKIDEAMASIDTRTRFALPLNSGGGNSTFFVPIPGEEHGTGALFSMLAVVANAQPERVPEELRRFWVRPLTFSGVGIDAIAVPFGSVVAQANSRLMLEYKHTFKAQDVFNHPLYRTSQIVCWEHLLGIGDTVQDEFSIFGTVREIGNLAPEVACVIGNLQRPDGTSYNHEVVVVGLKELIRLSFGVSYTTPPSVLQAAGARKSKKG